jgi:hypothetical protein
MRFATVYALRSVVNKSCSFVVKIFDIQSLLTLLTRYQCVHGKHRAQLFAFSHGLRRVFLQRAYDYVHVMSDSKKIVQPFRIRQNFKRGA